MKKVLFIALCCTSIFVTSCKKDNAAVTQYSEASQTGNAVQSIDDMSADVERVDHCMTPSAKSISITVTKSQDGTVGDADVRVYYKNKGDAGYIKVAIKWHTGQRAVSLIPVEHTVGDEQKLAEVQFIDFITQFPGTVVKLAGVSSKEGCPNKDSGIEPVDVPYPN